MLYPSVANTGGESTGAKAPPGVIEISQKMGETCVPLTSGDISKFRNEGKFCDSFSVGRKLTRRGGRRALKLFVSLGLAGDG